MQPIARFCRSGLARIASLPLLLFGPAAYAGSLTIPHTFTAGTPAVASQVNANFSATRLAVNDNDARITALESQVAALQSQLAGLQTQLAAINASTVMSLEPYLSLINVPDPNDAQVVYPTIRLSAVNLQIRAAGTGNPTGLGNLIIGNNELFSGTLDSHFRCSNGEYDDGPNCVFNGGTWATNHRSGSNNLIVGGRHRYSANYGVVFGDANTSSSNYAVVTGGSSNIARGEYSAISGGYAGVASGSRSSVSGGNQSTASGRWSSVSGGHRGLASGESSSVSGGAVRTASGQYNWRAGSLQENN